MKAASAILFTVLYALFSCFAVTGFAAAKCPLSICKKATFLSSENSTINTDNDCTHPFAVAAHTICKQINNVHGSGNKYLPLYNPASYKNDAAHTAFLYKQKLFYSKVTTPASCPLFIKHCVFLI